MKCIYWPVFLVFFNSLKCVFYRLSAYWVCEDTENDIFNTLLINCLQSSVIKHN